MYSLKKQFKKLFLNEHRVFPLANIISTYIDKKIKAAESEGIEIDESYFEEDTPEIKQLKSKWQNYYSKYSNVIINAIKKDNMSLYEILEIIDGFHKFYKRSGYEVQRRIASGDININNLKVSRGEDTTSNKRTKSRKSIELVEGLETKDYKVIHNGSDWLVIEPKTTQGSIAWAYGLPNGEEEKDKKSRVNWCTATYGKSLENNRFSMYAGNLHMFYFIKKPYPVNIEVYNHMDDLFLQKNSDLFIDYEQVSRKYITNRRVCVSFIASKGEAILAIDKNQDNHGAVVDAENISFTTEESLLSAINNMTLYEKVKAIAKVKKETSFKEVYSKITLTMLKREIITLSSPENWGDLFSQLISYALYSKSESVLNFLFDKYRFYPDVLYSLLNNSNSTIRIVKFCCEIFTNKSEYSNYYLNSYPSRNTKSREIGIFCSTINNDKFYTVYNTVEKLSIFLKEVGNVKNKKGSPTVREKKHIFVNMFLGDYNYTRFIIENENSNKSHYQKFAFKEVLEEFTKMYPAVISKKLQDTVKEDKNLFKSYEASKYLAEKCNVDLITTNNSFENKYFLENQLLAYGKKLLTAHDIEISAIINIFLNTNSFNTAIKIFDKVGLKENRLAELINKKVVEIVKEFDYEAIDTHDKFFKTFTLFLKNRPNKRKVYYRAEQNLSYFVKDWIDHYNYIEYKGHDITWETIRDYLEDSYEAFKYLYENYKDTWEKEIWDDEIGEYIVLDDDYYEIKENMILKYIRLVLS